MAVDHRTTISQSRSRTALEPVHADLVAQILSIAAVWDAQVADASAPPPRNGWHACFAAAASRGFMPRINAD